MASSGEGSASDSEDVQAARAAAAQPRFTERLIPIKEQFFEASREMVDGDMVKAPNFTLAEAMSAIELMDPKMDGGCVRLGVYPSVEEVIVEYGWLKDMADAEVLATVDASLACLASWLEGAFIAQTLHTNLLLLDPDVLSVAVDLSREGEKDWDNVAEKTMIALAHGLAHLVLLIRHTIGTASCCEEEDFAMQFPIKVSSSLAFEETVELMKSTEKALAVMGKKDKPRARILAAIADRLTWTRTTLLAMQHMIITHGAMFDDEGGAVDFVPELRQAVEHLSTAVEAAKRFCDNFELGMMAPVGQDGNYDWLTCFIPDLNRRYIPAQFPRKSEFLTRRHGLRQLEKMTRRFYDIASEVPHVVGDLSTIIQYLRTFCEMESCALSRAVLQLVVLPNDERVMGTTYLSDIIKASIRKQTGAPMLYPNTPTNNSEALQEMLNDVVQDITRVYLTVIQTFGYNLARQRDRIGSVFDDFNCLMTEADRLDHDAMSVTATHAAANGGKQEGPPAGAHMAAFVTMNAIRLVHWYMELGFRLEIFAEYEYACVYWYMRDIVSKWLFSWMDQSQKYLYHEYNYELNKLKAERERSKKKVNMLEAKCQKLESEYRKRLAGLKVLFVQGEESMYTAYHFVCLGLQASGRIKIPAFQAGVSERLRYEHRFAEIKHFGHPLHVSYDSYKNLSHYESTLAQGALKCFNDAAIMFKTAREALNVNKEDARCAAMARLAGTNHIVCSILASGARPSAGVEFDFSDRSFPFHPTLRIVDRPQGK